MSIFEDEYYEAQRLKQDAADQKKSEQIIIAVRDKWWIEQMENLMKETTLRPLDITYSNYLIVKWEQFKQSLEEKDGRN